MALAEKIHEGVKRHMEKSAAKEKGKKEHEKKKGKKEVSHFRVEPAEGGHVVETHFKSNDKHGMGHYEEPHRSVHKSMASVHKHMKSMCSCSECGTGNPEENDTGVVSN